MIWIMNWLMIRNYLATSGDVRRLLGLYEDAFVVSVLIWDVMGMGRGIAIYQLFWFWCSGPGTRILTIPDPRTSIEDYPIYLVFDLDMVHLTTLDRKIMGQMVRRRLRHAPCHCSRPLDEKYPSWGLVWHPLLQWLLSQNQGSWDVRLPTDSICVCSQACFCNFWRCFPT